MVAVAAEEEVVVAAVGVEAEVADLVEVVVVVAAAVGLAAVEEAEGALVEAVVGDLAEAALAEVDPVAGSAVAAGLRVSRIGRWEASPVDHAVASVSAPRAVATSPAPSRVVVVFEVIRESRVCDREVFPIVDSGVV